ncbi:MAG: peptidylprolyl isomerase [Acutalibacteraceae bacterium]
MKKQMIGLLAAVVAISAALVGCGSNNGQSSQVSSAESSVSSTVSESMKMRINQLDINWFTGRREEIAVIDTNMGVMKMRLFPNAAPKTVENFTTLAKQGYYNGQIFHRVINDFMIQGGDPTGTGTGGENIWGTDGFEDEFNANLLNIRGSVAMANRGKNTNGSQFFINQKKAESFEGWDYYTSLYNNFRQNQAAFLQAYGSCPNVYRITDDVKTLYEQNGGSPTLDGYYSVNQTGHTVFGQIFEGLDVLDAIAAVETDSNTDKPLTDVVINSITIEQYHAE